MASEPLVSKNPRTIVTFIPDPADYDKIEGTLETYFETGMECMGLILYDKTKLIPNDKFDPTKPEEGMNFPFFHDHSGIHFISSLNLLQVEDGPITVMVKDREMGAEDGYRLSFYPQGYSLAEWTALFRSGNMKATLWIRKKEIVK